MKYLLMESETGDVKFKGTVDIISSFLQSSASYYKTKDEIGWISMYGH